MKTFNEFLETAKDQIQKALPDAEVDIRRINKLQGESYVGISVQPEGAAAAATFNVNPAYEWYRANEANERTIIDGIVTDVKYAVSSFSAFELSDIMDYEKVKDHLMMQVIPAERNQDMLADIPHRTVEDIVVVYRIELPDHPERSATTLVTNKLLEQYGISAEQLHEDAVAAQTKNHPPVLRNMSDMMAEMSGGMMDLPESPIWVATTEAGQYGASVVQIPEFMERAAEQLGGDYFVLPSSIHECLFILDNGSFDRGQLEDMVRSVNATEVSEADFLSDSVYRYDASERIFEKAETYEKRLKEQAETHEAEHRGDEIYETDHRETGVHEANHRETEMHEADAREADLYEADHRDAVASTLTVLLVEPEKYPQKMELGTELADLQKAVGGNIEVVYPFDDPVGLVMNEEGKLDGLPMNRALRDDEGNIYDVIAGSFLVVGLKEDDFGSLTPEQIQKYEEHFHQPEVFIRMGKGIMALPIPDEAIDLQKARAVAKEDKNHMGHIPEKPRMKKEEASL